MNNPMNKTIINRYLGHYSHSPQSKKMRESSLRFFFGVNFPIGNGKVDKNWFNYEDHVFEIDNEIIMDYFDYLKNLDSLSITTRKNKWHIFLSFLNYTVYLYGEKYNFVVAKPPSEFIKFENAITKKTRVISNRKIFATKDEIKKILSHLNDYNFKHYLIFRLFVETGIRKGELINAKVHELVPEERYINPLKGKKGEKLYVYSENLAKLLKIYLKERMSLSLQHEYLFLTKDFNKYGNRTFNKTLKGTLDAVGIDKNKRNITCHTFRRTINDLRKGMNCTLEDRKELVGHKLRDVNVSSYTYSDNIRLRELYDKWNPYQDLNL